MNNEQSLWYFLCTHKQKLLDQTFQHINLTLTSIVFAILIGLPVGVYVARKPKLAGVVLGIASVFQTIPSIALLGFLVPIAGIGAVPAIIALFLYGLLPIVRNTYAGILGIDMNIREAATAMGMNRWTILLKVDLPLASPMIWTGIRTATVINVGVATLAAYIAAGGLGEFIFGGISLNNANMILAGAIPAAILALSLDFVLSLFQKIKFKGFRLTVGAITLLIATGFFYVSSVISHTGLLVGFTPEFMGRKDGYPDLQKVYHFRMNPVVVNDAMMYQAAYENELDVISGYSTDGRIKTFGLDALKDDKHIFPPYNAAPIIRTAVLQKHPELGSVVNLLAGRINDSIMTDLNYRADYLHQEPERVAEDFLKSQGIWRPRGAGNKGIIRIGSKIFAEQYILCNMYAILIEGYTDYKVEMKIGLGGTKICFEALVNGYIDLYPEYTGTGLVVILKASDQIITALKEDKNAVYQYVREKFIHRYQIQWMSPIGFNNTYALMMRRSQIKKLAISSITDLVTLMNKQ